jgi:hypothetical protein
MPRKKIGDHRTHDTQVHGVASAGGALLHLKPKISMRPRATKSRRVHCANVSPKADDATSADLNQSVTQDPDVGAPNCDSHVPRVNRRQIAIAGDDLTWSETPMDNVIATIRAQWRQRQAWHRAEKSLTLQAKAMCRALAEGGDIKEADKIYSAALGKGEHPMSFIARAATMPLVEARDSIEEHRLAIEKLLSKQAKSLPVAPWVGDVRGFGILSLAAIVGEAGDLSNYSNPAKLWKRMGLAVMPNGERQRRFADKDMAIAAGYNPSRRSVVWNIGDCLIKASSPQYRAVYDARRLRTAVTHPDWPKAHSHADATRVMTKRLLLDLWKAWRAAKTNMTSIEEMSPAKFLKAAE